MLPSFLIVGAQKAGTSWLAKNVACHPNVFVFEKEIHFFDKAKNFQRGTNWYSSHFKERTESAVGEKTPDYLWTDSDGAEDHVMDSHRRIHNVVPDAKLIMVLREPIARALSAAKHMMVTNRISPFASFDQVFKRQLDKKSRPTTGLGLFKKGSYARQIRDFKTLFPEEQMLVLFYETQIKQHKMETLQTVCDYIGVNPTFEFSLMNSGINVQRFSQLGIAWKRWIPFGKRFASRMPVSTPKISNGVLNQMQEYYRDSNKEVAEILGRELPTEWQY